MRKIFALASNFVQLSLRSPITLIMAFVMPVIFTAAPLARPLVICVKRAISASKFWSSTIAVRWPQQSSRQSMPRR